MVYVFTLGAALLFGLGSVIQQRVAFDAPPGKSLRPSLLLWLVRQPVWLVGVGTAAVGNVLSASALAVGSVALVQPLLVTRLLFAVPLSAVWARQRLVLRDWAGMVAVSGGLAGFLVVGRPRPEQHSGTDLLPWLYTALAIGVPIAVLVMVARRMQPRLEAPLLGAGAGMLFGMQSGLMHTAVGRFTDAGLTAMLLTPMTYGVAVTALAGTLLAQSAYEMAPLTASYPTLAAVEPLAGIGIGVGVLGSALAFGTVPLVLEVVALAVMTTGVYMLATSRLVTESAADMARRQAEEEAAAVEADVARHLEDLEQDLRRLETRRAGAEEHAERLRRVDADRETVAECLERLARLNEGVLAVAAEHGPPAPSGRGEGREGHEELMERYRQQLCEREEGLKQRSRELDERLDRLRV